MQIIIPSKQNHYLAYFVILHITAFNKKLLNMKRNIKIFTPMN